MLVSPRLWFPRLATLRLLSRVSRQVSGRTGSLVSSETCPLLIGQGVSGLAHSTLTAWVVAGLCLGIVACGKSADTTASGDGTGSPTVPDSVAEGPHVLLITLDTCRADRLGCYGNETVQTPHLDALAAESTLFENAFTPIPSTLPSHCSIMTGLYPAAHGVHDNGVYVLAEEADTLAECFQEKGYATGAFVSAFVLDAQFNLDQGFTTYDDEVDLPLSGDDPSKVPQNLPAGQRRWFQQLATAYQRRAPPITKRALTWLREQGDRPWFLWAHYFDPHAPYQAPGKWETKYDPNYQGAMDGTTGAFWKAVRERSLDREKDLRHMRARYDGEVSYMDEWIGELLEGVRREGLWDDTVVIIVADHGEAFGDHGQVWEHNGELYDEVMKVPFLLRRPDGVGAGTRVNGLVRTIDVAPTVLDLLGWDAWAGIQGVSLVPLTESPEAEAPGEILLEAMREKQVHTSDDESYLGLRTDRFKIILNLGKGDVLTRTEVYDMTKDPNETSPLDPSGSRQLEQHRERILKEYRAMKAARGSLATRDLEEVDYEALEQLGYISDQ